MTLTLNIAPVARTVTQTHFRGLPYQQLPPLPNIPDEDVVIGVRSTVVQSIWSPEKISQAQHDDPVISIVLQTRLNTTKREEPPSDWTDNRELRRYRQVWKQLKVVDGVLHRRVAASDRKDGLVLVVPR